MKSDTLPFEGSEIEPVKAPESSPKRMRIWESPEPLDTNEKYNRERHARDFARKARFAGMTDAQVEQHPDVQFAIRVLGEVWIRSDATGNRFLSDPDHIRKKSMGNVIGHPDAPPSDFADMTEYLVGDFATCIPRYGANEAIFREKEEFNWEEGAGKLTAKGFEVIMTVKDKGYKSFNWPAYSCRIKHPELCYDVEASGKIAKEAFYNACMVLMADGAI